jgi:ABC-type Fe3+ transport system substrate-binding protein
MLIEFKNQGLAANVLPLTDILKYTSGSGGLMAFANAPHPNATKVYANWLLSRAAQMRIAQTVGYNSRRTDVPAGEPLFTVDPSRIDEYLNSQSEEMLPYFEKVVHYARKVERLGAGVPAR